MRLLIITTSNFNMRYLILFLLLLSTKLMAQIVNLEDIKSRKIIPFATATFFLNNQNIKFDYFNEKGQIIINEDFVYDYVAVSCVGFESRIFLKTIFVKTIQLEKKEILLNEIVITNNKENKLKQLGLYGTPVKITMGFSKGMEICIFIKNENQILKKMHSFIFELPTKTKKKSVVRLHTYKRSERDFEPGDEILNYNITKILNTDKNSKMQILLQEEDINLPPDGLFIGLEFLGYLDETENIFFNENYEKGSTKLKLNDNLNESLTFIRNRVKKEKWDNTLWLKNNLSKIAKFKNIPNVSFGITVYD